MSVILCLYASGGTTVLRDVAAAVAAIGEKGNSDFERRVCSEEDIWRISSSHSAYFIVLSTFYQVKQEGGIHDVLFWSWVTIPMTTSTSVVVPISTINSRLCLRTNIAVNFLMVMTATMTFLDLSPSFIILTPTALLFFASMVRMVPRGFLFLNCNSIF